MNRVLLAWEGGAGRGHVVTLARIARALAGAAECDAALGWMDHAGEIAPWCGKVFPGVRLPYDRKGRSERGAPPNATWADYLADCGLGRGERLARNVAWWLDTFVRRDVGLVIGDYAPCALMAARIAGLPALAAGTGYGIPPAALERFPVFLPEYAQREVDEAALTATINAALGPLGLPRLRYLPEIYARAGELVRTLPLLDPYRALRDPAAYLPPVADFAGLASGEGDEAFCYFSTTEFANQGLVEALLALDMPLRCFLPNAPAELRGRLARAGVAVEDAPVPVELIAARSRLVLNSGQHGIVCLALAAGLPQVCLPQHLEQLYHARQVEAEGAARVVWPRDAAADTIREAVAGAYGDAAMARRARELGVAVAPHFLADDAGLLRERIASLL